MKRRNTGNGVKVSECGKFATVRCGNSIVKVRYEGRKGKGEK